MCCLRNSGCHFSRIKSSNITKQRLLSLASLICWCAQLIMRSETRYFARGSVIADRHEQAKGLMVVTSGQVKSLYTQHVLRCKSGIGQFFCWYQVGINICIHKRGRTLACCFRRRLGKWYLCVLIARFVSLRAMSTALPWKLLFG